MPEARYYFETPASRDWFDLRDRSSEHIRNRTEPPRTVCKLGIRVPLIRERLNLPLAIVQRNDVLRLCKKQPPLNDDSDQSCDRTG